MTDKIPQQIQLLDQHELPLRQELDDPHQIELIREQLLLLHLLLTCFVFVLIHLLLVEFDVPFWLIECDDAETDCRHVDIPALLLRWCMLIEVLLT